MKSIPSPLWRYAWALGAVALGGASLLIPLYVVELGGDPFTLGILAASAALVGAPGALVFGRLADKSAHRSLFVVGALVIVAVVLGILPLLESMPLIIALNAAVWFAFASAGPVLILMAVADVEASAWQTEIALLNRYQGWGWTGGLVLGAIWTGVAEGVLGTIDAQRIFFVACAACAFLGAAGVFRYHPTDTQFTLNPVALRRAMLQAARMNVRGATFPFTPGRVYDWTFRKLDPQLFIERFTRQLSIYYGAVLFFFAGFAAFFAPLPIYLDDIGFSSGVIFGLYLISSLGAAMFFVHAGKLAQTYNISAVQTMGLLLRGLSLPVVAVVGLAAGAGTAGLLLTGVLFLLIGIAWAVIAVTAATLVTKFAPEVIRGEALGMYAAAGALAGALGSIAGGWLAGIHYGLAFGAAGTLVLLGAALVYSLRRTPQLAEAPSPAAPKP